MIENWIPVPDYPGYLVSDLGRVQNKRGSLLKPRMTKSNYFIVDLSADGKAKSFYVHKLVAELFVDKQEMEGEELKTHVIHLNLNKEDNRAVNLKWVTKSESRSYAFNHEDYEFNSIKDTLQKGDIELDARVPREGNFKNIFYRYNGRYYKVYDTKTALVIIDRDKEDHSFKYISIARDILGNPPGDNYIVGYRDFDYRNLSRKNLMWETFIQKSERYMRYNPLHKHRMSLTGKTLNPPSFTMTPKRKENILKMRENGKSLRKISKLVNIPVTTLHKHLKEWEDQ